MKIAVIGAGSSYTPEIIEKLAEMKNEIPVDKITLMDIDEKRLGVMLGFCRRFAKSLGLPAEIVSTIKCKEAVEGADFVITQIRVGGNLARVNDEKIPMKYGLIGQETTGAGGFAKALRTIPAMIDIAHDVEKYSPDAWIVNYTNPTGIVTEAVTKYTKAKIAGLCAGGLFPGIWVEKFCGTDRASVHYDYFGLNHLNFAYNVTIDGRPLTTDDLAKVAEGMKHFVDASYINQTGLIPSPYLQYYFHTARKFKEMSTAELTRGEEVMKLETEIFNAYADESQNAKPEALSKRGGGGYSEVALGIIDAITNSKEKWMVVNVPNNGAIKFLPDNAVVEIGCIVDRTGIKPIPLETVPNSVWGLVAAVKNYEQLTVEAAISGDRNIALSALVAHPLIRDLDVASPLLEDLLEVNRGYLPQFFK